MIRLNLSSTPSWIDLGHGVEVLVPPLTTALIAMARESELFLALPEDASIGRRAACLTVAIAEITIADMRGVVLADDSPAPANPQNIRALMDIYSFSKQFYDLYVAPGLVVTEEKKGSAPLPNGILAGAPATASIAKSPHARAARALKKPPRP